MAQVTIRCVLKTSSLENERLKSVKEDMLLVKKSGSDILLSAIVKDIGIEQEGESG